MGRQWLTRSTPTKPQRLHGLMWRGPQQPHDSMRQDAGSDSPFISTSTHTQANTRGGLGFISNRLGFTVRLCDFGLVSRRHISSMASLRALPPPARLPLAASAVSPSHAASVVSSAARRPTPSSLRVVLRLLH